MSLCMCVTPQLNEIAANMMSTTPGVALLDAFELTVTVTPSP